MELDLNTIKSGIAAIEGLKAIYRPLEHAEDALVSLANLEATRIALEPKVAALKDEKAALELQVDGINGDITKAADALQAALDANAVSASQHLADAKAKADAEAGAYKSGLMSAFGELKADVDSLNAETSVLADKKGALLSEIHDLEAKRDSMAETLAELTAKSEELKSKLRQLAGL